MAWEWEDVEAFTCLRSFDDRTKEVSTSNG